MTSRCRIISPNEGPWSPVPVLMELGAPLIETPASGWDVMRELLWVPYSPYFAKGDQRGHRVTEVPGAVMFAQDEKVVGYKAGFPVVELTSLGIAAAKGYKAELQAGSEGRFNSTNNGGWPHPNAPTWPSVVISWLSTVPLNPIDRIRVPAIPPETFGLDDYVAYTWVAADYPDPYQMNGVATLNGISHGWFIERTEQLMLVGSRYVLITDYYLLDYATET